MAKKTNYFGNLVKEVKESAKAYKATGEASNKSGPGTDARANMLKRKEQKQMGQLFGAILQGRRYDSVTGKQIKDKKKR
jgi:predicted lactoylglutathione lyase